MDEKNLPKLDTVGFETRNEKTTFMWQKDEEKQNAKQEKRGSILKSKAAHIVSRIGGDKDKDESRYNKLLIKTGICAGIAVVILAISSINSPVANTITESIDAVVNHEFDIDEDIGRLKFVQSLDEGEQSVFSPAATSAVVPPVSGEVITCFGEGGSSGVRMSSVDNEVVCIAKGTVTATGLIDGNGYVKILLDTGQEVSMYNISPVVLVDDIVSPGQRIGSITGDYLYIEMKQDDVFIDPALFIETGLGVVNR